MLVSMHRCIQVHVGNTIACETSVCNTADICAVKKSACIGEQGLLINYACRSSEIRKEACSQLKEDFVQCSVEKSRGGGELWGCSEDMHQDIRWPQLQCCVCACVRLWMIPHNYRCN